MNKAIMAFAVLAMVGIVGCGGGLEKEYEAIRREFWTIIPNGEKPGESLEVDMQKFRAASTEEQKKLIESAKKALGLAKAAAAATALLEEDGNNAKDAVNEINENMLKQLGED